MYRNWQEIESVVSKFQQTCLPRQEWTHAAHLTVACWYLGCYPLPDAIAHIRQGIQRYNQAIGILTTPTGGYHETLTLFWIHQVNWGMQSWQGTNKKSVEQVNYVIEQCGDPELPLTYYSRDRLFSWEARTTWIHADLRSLPETDF